MFAIRKILVAYQMNRECTMGYQKEILIRYKLVCELVPLCVSVFEWKSAWSHIHSNSQSISQKKVANTESVWNCRKK